MRKIERFDMYMRYKGLNDNQVTTQLGLSNGLLGKSRKENRDLSSKVIEQILSHYEDLSKVWLITGEGEMLITQGLEENGGLSLPLVPIDAIGGALSGTNGQWMEYDAEKYIVPAFRSCDFLIRVDGDSMYPKYQKGDIVACKKVPLTDIWFQWGKVYVVDTRQGALIKYVEPGNDNEHITLASENQRYKPFLLPLDELNGVAIVKGLIRVE